MFSRMKVDLSPFGMQQSPTRLCLTKKPRPNRPRKAPLNMETPCSTESSLRFLVHFPLSYNSHHKNHNTHLLLLFLLFLMEGRRNSLEVYHFVVKTVPGTQAITIVHVCKSRQIQGHQFGFLSVSHFSIAACHISASASPHKKIK